MNSPTALNYEIRPCKFVERKMLLASFSRIISRFKLSYQYIGFGGLSFTDFKLFHKELNINSMFSIEGGDYSIQKLNLNIPFSCISILHGMSTQELQSIDLKKPSIIWLDYDDTLSMTIFQDINIVFNSILPGSMFLISCNRQLRNESATPKHPYSPDELRDLFGDIVPFNVESDCCSDDKVSTTIREMLLYSCNKIIAERNKHEESIKFVPLYNIKYSEYRGARMYTFGGIILKSDYDETSLNIDDLDFIRSEEPFEIKVPNLTYRERLYINQIIGDTQKEEEAIRDSIITKEDLDDYKKSYKYIPNFYDVRL